MKFLLLIIIAFVLISGYFVLSRNSTINVLPKPSQIQSPSPTPQVKTFKSSSVMKFTIDVPSDSSVEEKFAYVTITNSNGKINIGQNGTNFNSINDYLKFLEEKNRFTLVNKRELLVDNSNTVTGFIEDEKIYFIFSKSNYTIYSISTKSKLLYATLDQIAQSFRYTP